MSAMATLLGAPFSGNQPSVRIGEGSIATAKECDKRSSVVRWYGQIEVAVVVQITDCHPKGRAADRVGNRIAEGAGAMAEQDLYVAGFKVAAGQIDMAVLVEVDVVTGDDVDEGA